MVAAAVGLVLGYRVHGLAPRPVPRWDGRIWGVRNTAFPLDGVLGIDDADVGALATDAADARRGRVVLRPLPRDIVRRPRVTAGP